jgi:hypothetical protein
MSRFKGSCSEIFSVMRIVEIKEDFNRFLSKQEKSFALRTRFSL